MYLGEFTSTSQNFFGIDDVFTIGILVCKSLHAWQVVSRL
jgi:hypothetical protein